MHAYFHGWRRMTGCGTLVMACVFAAGWVRSFNIPDALHFAGRWMAGPNVVIRSCHGSLTFETIVDPNWGEWLNRFQFKLPEWRTTDVIDSREYEGVVWHWRLCGFSCSTEIDRYRQCTTPYWSIVIPLTLLSAWLLLGKPRREKKTEPHC